MDFVPDDDLLTFLFFPSMCMSLYTNDLSLENFAVKRYLFISISLSWSFSQEEATDNRRPLSALQSDGFATTKSLQRLSGRVMLSKTERGRPGKRPSMRL